MRRLAELLWRPWWTAAACVLDGMEAILARGRLRLVLALLVSILAWFVYVPVHELLHAAGCVLAGGTVQELQIQWMYGGALLERLLPVVRTGGEYAGRLARFDTAGSDLTYLVTVAAPLALSLGALPLLGLSARRGAILPFGAGVVLLVGLLASLPGDLYEIGSILVSRLLGLVTPIDPERLAAIRHEDLLALLASFPARFPAHRAAWGAAVAASLVVGLLGATLLLQASRLLLGRRRS